MRAKKKGDEICVCKSQTNIEFSCDFPSCSYDQAEATATPNTGAQQPYWPSHAADGVSASYMAPHTQVTDANRSTSASYVQVNDANSSNSGMRPTANASYIQVGDASGSVYTRG